MGAFPLFQIQVDMKRKSLMCHVMKIYVLLTNGHNNPWPVPYASHMPNGTRSPGIFPPLGTTPTASALLSRYSVIYP